MKSIIAFMLFGLFAFSVSANADDTLARGKVVYGKYCAKCHGINADGRGKDAYKYKPAPTNFHVARAPLPYVLDIIKKGGKGVNRSDNMPDWDGDLSKEQIEDVAKFVVSIRGDNK